MLNGNHHLFCDYSVPPPHGAGSGMQAEAGFRGPGSPSSRPHPSPLLPPGSGLGVPVPGSLPRARFQRSLLYQRSCSHELLVGLWGDGSASGWRLESLFSSQRCQRRAGMLLPDPERKGEGLSRVGFRPLLIEGKLRGSGRRGCSEQALGCRRSLVPLLPFSPSAPNESPQGHS